MLAATRKPKLVIFDCDGVLVDSEPIFNRVLHEFLLSCGAELSFSECCNTFTGKNKDAVEDFLSAKGLFIPENWSDQFYRQALEALGREVTPIRGVETVIEELSAAGVKLCVASNGIQAKMEVTLSRTQLLSRFEGNIFSAYDIGLSKPAPDVFLHAAQSNGCQPSDCVVIEDSPSGFEAASNARMRCYAYLPDRESKEPNLFGAYEFNDMSELPNLLGLV